MSTLITTDVVEAAASLRNGGLVAFPTETVYGLGADATNDAAVDRIYVAKGRPVVHPVIVHVLDVADLDTWAEQVPDYARDLATDHWPGPLTLVLARRSGLGERAAGGAATIGLRSPSHPVARALLAAFGGAIAAPSANRFGRVSTTTAAHVVAELADVLDPTIDRILDGGPCDVGVESTIVDCTGERPRLLRSGQVTVEQVEATTGLSVEAGHGVNPAPGTLPAHYAPDALVVLTEGDGVDDQLAAIAAEHPGARVGLLARDVVADRPGVLRLAAPNDSEAYARVLFAALRAADDAALDVVVAVPPPDEGVGSAVADRLRRAAHGTMAS